MALKLYNSLTKKFEDFTPLNPEKVGLYSCGPTVYNYLHIGNLRAYVFADILRRTLIYNGFSVSQIMNVTDIGHLTSDADLGDDKMVKAILREGKPLSMESLDEIAEFYFAKAKEDMVALNILPANQYVFASHEIPAQIKLIEQLIAKGFTYQTSDGIYFNTEKFPSYGRLGGSASSDHSRLPENSEKKDPRDFALWKFSTDEALGFPAPFGRGFPGWHIECSAMSMKYLGDQFDIHTGGVDHISVHHNNEIAQSEAVTGKILARYWLHNEHITIGENKMAKSGEFLTLQTLGEAGVKPLAYRYWLLGARYSTRLDYSLEAVMAAQTAYTRLTNFVGSISETGQVNKDYLHQFTQFINEDLDTPKALALVWDLIKDDSVTAADKKATLLNFDQVLGLGLVEIKEAEIPPAVLALAQERETARTNADWAKADQLRAQIEELGYAVKDTENGQKILAL